MKNGFMDWYLIWKRHGEIIKKKRRCTQVGESSSANITVAAAAMNDVPSDGGFDETQFDASFDDPYGVNTELIFEKPRRDAKEFFDLL
ncbi:hypothetical protein SLA2020_027490 [Shorea laevis]